MRFADPAQSELIGELLGVLSPAIRQTMIELAEAAAAEISPQLAGQEVEVRLVDGDPELVVTQLSSPPPPPPPPDAPSVDYDEARITLRIPGYLKEVIADAASGSGDSVNSWIVDALRSRTTTTKVGDSVHRTIEL